MLVSEGWYAKLDPDTKALVKKAAKEAAQYEWKWAAEQNDIAKKQCLDHGMELSELTDEPVWQEKARSIWPQFEEQVGGKAMIDEALSLMN
jgi:TRAP-type C4-dicarboxylate transport system substrate-binding protein